MLEIKNVNKSFGNLKVLNNLSCTINENIIYGLVGANGAGKSTLLRIINGIYHADTGEILLDGIDIHDNSSLKQNLVFVSDDIFFFNSFTLLDCFKYYNDLYDNFDMVYALDIANLLKLDINRKFNTFSKGMKRQCALICALATNAQYMFFDETFDGLDPVIRNVIKKVIMRKMVDKKITIIMTSHNIRELEDICDNLGLLYKGGILFESDINSIKTNMFKVQISFKEDYDKDKFKGIKLLSYKKSGSVATLIIKDSKEKDKLEKLKPLLLDYLPLTLEEVFIYEMEALGYEFNEII